jgi:hypothetical protein
MRRWLFWGSLVLLGLAAGSAATTGLMHATGLSVSRRPVAVVDQPIPEETPAALHIDLSSFVADLRQRIAHLQLLGPPQPAHDDAPHSLFETSQIVSFYGSPLSPLMGALGEGTLDQMAARLRKQAAVYQALNPDKKVVPALHLIYEVAQEYATDDGLYLYYSDSELVQDYISFTQSQGMLLFLDLQIGRSTLPAELAKVMPYLKAPNVHLAIDPEFVTPPGMRPGLDIGTLDCQQVNAALDTIEAMVEQEHLPNKIVILHQFQTYMLSNREKLNFDEPRVDLVLDMDGYGDQSGKLENYDKFVRQSGAKYGGIKLFYTHDVGLLREQQIENLVPQPNVIIYQ